MLSHLALKFIQSFDLSSSRCHIVVLCLNRSVSKVDLTVEKKHMLFGSRVVHFWTRIWSNRGDGLKTGTEVRDDCKTANGDGCKTPGSDGETSNKLLINMTNIMDRIKWNLINLLFTENVVFSWIKKNLRHFS